ncbi:unnamed protein product [Symbiodinium sp. CCMP2592]|nr:unnamed protein product [Symbiodinium sp. CCMP2592]
MRFCLLLIAVLVRAHRESQHFAVQLDEEIEESPPMTVSPQNWSSVLGSIGVEPVRVHLLAGVYPNMSFTLPAGAKLELQGERGVKVEEIVVRGSDSTDKPERSRHKVAERAELTLKSFQLARASLEHAVSSLALIDVAVGVLQHPGSEEEDESMPNSSRFESYVKSSGCIACLTIQNSVLIPMYIFVCGFNATVIDSTLMPSVGDQRRPKNKWRNYLSVFNVFIERSHLGGPEGALDIDESHEEVESYEDGSARGITVVNSTLDNVTVQLEGNVSIKNSSMIGKYEVITYGKHYHGRIENSYFGLCTGHCVHLELEESDFVLVGSSMQTAIQASGSTDLNLEIRHLEVFDVHCPFLEYFQSEMPGTGGGKGRPMLNVTLAFVKFRNVWSAVKIDANDWRLAMHHVEIRQAMLTGVTVQSRDATRAGIAQLRNLSMRDMPVGVLADHVVADITAMTAVQCSIGISARASSLNMREVDVLGKHRQSSGIMLKSSVLEANDIRMTNLAAGLLLSSTTVNMQGVFITDNALGTLSVNSTGTIKGLIYFNDAADEVCSSHNVCPQVEHRSAAMEVHHAKAMMFSLLGCLVATISAVQGLKLLYTEKALSLRMLFWMLGCSLWLLVLIGAVSVLVVIRRAVQEQDDQNRPNLAEFTGPERKMMVRLVALLLWSAGGMLYVFFDVYLHRHSLMLSGDAKLRKELDEKKAQLKERLDNKSLRRRMQSMHQKLFAALDDRNKDDSKRIFQEMKVLAEEEAKNLGGWFEDQRKVYQDEDAGARMQKLEQIASQDGEAVQPPLKDHYFEKEEAETKEAVEVKKSAVDALWTYASWLRRDFKGQLGQLLADLNEFSAKDVREFDEKLQLDPSMHRLQHEDGAEVGPHLGLLVASIKSKERALAKINTDYQEDFKAGKKKEEPLARYVCDFLRATIYAADPFALALAFHEFKKRFKIVRVKNKFANEKLKTEERTNILVNFWVESGDMKQIGEVQFLMQEYLTAKSIQHLYYDVARAKSEDELFDKPIFA